MVAGLVGRTIWTPAPCDASANGIIDRGLNYLLLARMLQGRSGEDEEGGLKHAGRQHPEARPRLMHMRAEVFGLHTRDYHI